MITVWGDQQIRKLSYDMHMLMIDSGTDASILVGRIRKYPQSIFWARASGSVSRPKSNRIIFNNMLFLHHELNLFLVVLFALLDVQFERFR